MISTRQERLYLVFVLCIEVIIILLRPTLLGVVCAVLIAVALLTFLESTA